MSEEQTPEFNESDAGASWWLAKGAEPQKSARRRTNPGVGGGRRLRKQKQRVQVAKAQQRLRGRLVR